MTINFAILTRIRLTGFLISSDVATNVITWSVLWTWCLAYIFVLKAIWLTVIWSFSSSLFCLMISCSLPFLIHLFYKWPVYRTPNIVFFWLSSSISVDRCCDNFWYEIIVAVCWDLLEVTLSWLQLYLPVATCPTSWLLLLELCIRSFLLTSCSSHIPEETPSTYKVSSLRYHKTLNGCYFCFKSLR